MRITDTKVTSKETIETADTKTTETIAATETTIVNDLLTIAMVVTELNNKTSQQTITIVAHHRVKTLTEAEKQSQQGVLPVKSRISGWLQVQIKIQGLDNRFLG